MSITKEMLAKCQNEQLQAWAALPMPVRAAISNNREHTLFLTDDGQWASIRTKHFDGFLCSGIYRLDPKMPIEQEFEEYQVVIGPDGVYATQDPTAKGTLWRLYGAVVAARFLGIIYQKDGVETLRTSIDAAFGTPVRVRFAK